MDGECHVESAYSLLPESVFFVTCMPPAPLSLLRALCVSNVRLHSSRIAARVLVDCGIVPNTLRRANRLIYIYREVITVYIKYKEVIIKYEIVQGSTYRSNTEHTSDKRPSRSVDQPLNKIQISIKCSNTSRELPPNPATPRLVGRGGTR